jgi:hypothetical protein
MVAWQRGDHGVFAREVSAMTISRVNITGKNLIQRREKEIC